MMAVQSLDECADNKFRVLCFAPRYDSQDARLHRQIEHGNTEDRQKNSARDVSFRITNFSSEVADVVVAPVAVDRVHHCGAQPRKPYPRERERARRKIERHFRIKMARTSPDEPEKSADNSGPQQD